MKVILWCNKKKYAKAVILLQWTALLCILLSFESGFTQNQGFPKRDYSEKDFPCLNDAVHTQLDFALGHWEILVNGLLVGHIALEKDARGCMIKEKFTVLNGYSGAGFDHYDFETNTWKRILVVSNGTVESFEGKLEGKKFIWMGKEVRVDGTVVLERVEMWREGSKVINHIFQSTNQGRTWKRTGAEIRIPKGSY
ncbi:MAG: hypothetical protein AAF348_19770 [Bacteroidota bacterium]